MTKKKVFQQSLSIEDAEKVDNEIRTSMEEDEEEHKRKMKKKRKKRDKMKTQTEEENTLMEIGGSSHLNTHSDEIEFKIETISENPDKISPFIGYFPSGFNPCPNSPQSQPRVGVFRHVKRSNRLQLVVSPNNSSSQVDFVGTNYAGEATAAQVCSYALGVVDKATRTLKMVPISANKIFRLEPRVAEAGLTDNEVLEISKGELTQQEKAEKIKDLTLMYSTKKTIRKVKKMDSLHQKQDPKSQEYLDKKLEDQKINKEAVEVADTTSDARNIPPYDMSATTPQMAYPLDKIILKGEWDYLLDIYELSQVGGEVKPNVYPSFVCNRVHKLEHIKDEGWKQTLACIFSYITHLIKFKDKHSMDGFSSAKHHKIPSILSLKFSDMFVDSDSKRLSDEKRDLVISYILVLTLFADDFKTDPADIARDLRMSSIKLRPHFEHLGCKLVREGTLSMVKLALPLKFPMLRRRRRRG
ncbi:hypothetical protein LguiB_008457 [Lonicera macranthoides]